MVEMERKRWEKSLWTFTRRGEGSDVPKQLLSICSLGRIGNKWGNNKNWKTSPLSCEFWRTKLFTLLAQGSNIMM